MSRHALIIGINEYQHARSLNGCENDAENVEKRLLYNPLEEKERNFFTTLITSKTTAEIDRRFVKDKIEEFFRDKREISLLYFSGHGWEENGQGYLVTSECEEGDEGVPVIDILKMANDSPATNRIIILDCCHAGAFGIDFLGDKLTRIAEGVTILAAADANQYAIEKGGYGIFTRLLCHALDGGAASILGEITPAGIYDYVDKAMRKDIQRPILTTKVRSTLTLRKIKAQISEEKLREITNLFKKPDDEFKLDRTYEWTNEGVAVQENIEIFKLLQLYNRVNLVVPVNATDMDWAAMNGTGCELTPQGKSYWEMVNRGSI